MTVSHANSMPLRCRPLITAAALIVLLAAGLQDVAAQESQPVKLEPPQKLVPEQAVPMPPESGAVPPLPESVQELLAPAAPATGAAVTSVTPSPLVTSTQPVEAETGIQIDSLRAINPETVGTLTSENGGLGTGMWAGTSRSLVERLLPRLPVGATSATMRDLMRRLLLTAASAPEGAATGSSLAVLRVEALAAMGDLVGVNSLLNAFPGQTQDQKLIRIEANARFLANDNGRACPLAANQIQDSDAPYWQKAWAFCQVLAGQTDRAALGVSLLREIGDGDEVFFALFDGLAVSEPPVIVSLPDPTSLHLAMARVAKAQLPVDVISSNHPGVLRAVAMSPNASKGLRLEAAELAEATGVLPIDALRQLYTSVQFSEQDLANPLSRAEVEFGPMVRALLYHTSLIQTVPIAQAEAVARAFALARDEGRYASAVRVFMPVLKRIPPSAELIWFAPEAVRAFMSVGDDQGVSTWFQLMRAAALFNPDGKKAIATALPVARLVGSAEARDWTGDSIAEWREAISEGEDAAVKTVLLFNLIEGLGDSVPEAAWDSLMTGEGRVSVSMPDMGVWRRLVKLAEPAPPAPAAAQAAQVEAEPQAADATSTLVTSQILGLPAETLPSAEVREPERVGETVLIVLLALGDGGPMRADPLLLRQVLLTLRRAGLASEARAMAVEAALAAGL